MTEQTPDRTPATTGDLMPDEWDDLLDTLPPASEDQGNAGHDMARAAARRAQAVRLRLGGATYEQVAQVAGYSDKGAARHAVMRSLARMEAESVSELRTLENARLDADELVLRSLIGDGNLPAQRRIQAIDSRLRLAARRARLNGLDAPVQVALSAGVAADLEDALLEAEATLVQGEVLSAYDEPMEG